MTLLALGALLSMGIFIKLMNVASCGDFGGQCDFSALDIAQWITPIVSVLCGIAALTALVRLRHRGVPLWWIPLIGCALTFTAFLVSSAMVDSAIH